MGSEKFHVEEVDHVTPQKADLSDTKEHSMGLNDSHLEMTDNWPGDSQDSHHIPDGYYFSANFIGTFIGVVLLAWSLYVGYILPSNTLTLINADLGPVDDYVLIVTVTTVVSGCLLTVVGRLGDIFGRRYFLIGGQTFGLLGGIVGCTAKNIPTLIGTGALLGVAGAVQLTFTFIICELVPNKHRAYWDSALFFCIIPFAALGPVVARLLATQTEASWRWYYYINIMTCASSIILFFFFYHPPGFKALNARVSKTEQLKKIDYVGIVLFSAGVILFMLGLSWGGSSYPWKSGTVIGCIVAGVLCLVVFVLYELYAKLEQPLLPMQLLRNRNYVAISITACVGTMIYFSMNVLWPQQVADLYATGEITIGWLSCTTGIGVICGQVIAGIVFKPLGRAKWQLLACCIGMTVFLGGLAAGDQYHEKLALAFTVLGGVSVGFLELITIIMAGLVCEPGDIGLASGFLASLRQVSGTIATTIYVTILENRLAKTIPANVEAAATAAGLPTSSLADLFSVVTTGNLTSVPGINSTITSAVDSALMTAESQAFKTVYLASIAFGGLSIIAALSAQNVDEKLTSHVARKLKGRGDSSKVDGKIEEP